MSSRGRRSPFRVRFNRRHSCLKKEKGATGKLQNMWFVLKNSLTTLGLSPRGFLWEKQAKPSSLARCTLFKCKVGPVRYQRIGRFVTRCRNFSTVFLLCALEVNTPKSDYQ